MINQTVSINNFSGLLKDEELPAGDLQTVLLVLSEISQKQDHFQANTSELVQLAAQHSPTFQALPAERQSFFRSVLSMPVFFYTVPLSDDEAAEGEKLNDKASLQWQQTPDLSPPRGRIYVVIPSVPRA
ncbi:hypothetical protein J8865_25710 [Klebsiella pneumoniae]